MFGNVMDLMLRFSGMRLRIRCTFSYLLLFYNTHICRCGMVMCKLRGVVWA